MGWQVQVFQDADEGTHYSGRSVKNRPGWLALLRRLHDPDVVAVVVSALDRASRSTKDFYDFLDSCHKAGVAFVSTSQELDTSTASGKFMLEMLAGLAAFEGNVAADRINATIAHQKSKGLYWGYPPFGCTRQPGGLLVPNSDITIVRRVSRPT
jgi:site-specific DNA recombinase